MEESADPAPEPGAKRSKRKALGVTVVSFAVLIAACVVLGIVLTWKWQAEKRTWENPAPAIEEANKWRYIQDLGTRKLVERLGVLRAEASAAPAGSARRLKLDEIITELQNQIARESPSLQIGTDAKGNAIIVDTVVALYWLDKEIESLEPE